MAPPRRRNAPQYQVPQCTHIRMTRQFDAEVKCDQCGKPSSSGWVYRCICEGDGQLPVEASGLSEDAKQEIIQNANQNGWNVPGEGPSYEERMFRAENDIQDISILKPWMIKAIAAGEYTSEQISKLIAQRMNVKEKIRQQEAQINAKEERQWLDRSQARDTILRYAPAGVDDQSPSILELFPPDSLEARIEKARKSARCNYKVCGTCKPALKERAWESFESVLESDDLKRYPGDVNARPLASPDVILGIGDRTKPISPTSTESTSSFDYESFEDQHIEEASRISVLQHTRSNPILNGVRKVFRDFVNTGSQYRNPGNRAASSSQVDKTADFDQEADRRAALEVERPQSRLDHAWDAEVMDRGFSGSTGIFGQHMPSSSIAGVLASAASRQLGESQSNENDGQEVTEGTKSSRELAMTEEAVEVDMADIITQV